VFEVFSLKDNQWETQRIRSYRRRQKYWCNWIQQNKILRGVYKKILFLGKRKRTERTEGWF